MLYLLDANVFIQGHKDYWPIDQFPEIWEWFCYVGRRGDVKILRVNFDEVQAGRKSGDPLLDWISAKNTQVDLLLDESANVKDVHVVRDCYGNDLSEDDWEQVGRDPFLIAYALADPANRTVVTFESRAPKKQGKNRRIPDICTDVGVECIHPNQLTRILGFTTGWNKKP
ncbi:MAG: DUF4411 family protein [Chloroflexi bacterium]|nr:DUF4411 family protein [Chloroflexota bacterium]